MLNSSTRICLFFSVGFLGCGTDSDSSEPLLPADTTLAPSSPGEQDDASERETSPIDIASSPCSNLPIGGAGGENSFLEAGTFCDTVYLCSRVRPDARSGFQEADAGQFDAYPCSAPSLAYHLNVAQLSEYRISEELEASICRIREADPDAQLFCIVYR